MKSTLGGNPNTYVVVFDIGRQGYTTWWSAIIPLIFLGVGIFIGVVEGRRLLGGAVAAGGLLFAVLLLVTTFGEYQRLRDDLLTGHALTAEGYVTDFRPDDNAGHVPETFSVRGVAFSVAAPNISAAFRHTVSSGGPDLTNTCARILYVRDLNENKILWLGLRISGCADT